MAPCEEFSQGVRFQFELADLHDPDGHRAHRTIESVTNRCFLATPTVEIA